MVESPSFIGSLNAFKANGVNLTGIPLEEDGMDLNALEDLLKTTPNVKLIYVIPNFQNPTGRTMSLEKRKGLYELACKYDTMILEDNPTVICGLPGKTCLPLRAWTPKAG